MKGNVAIITGGLSGIGKGTALELAKEHLTIIILDVQDDKAADVVKQIEALGSTCKYFHCDLTQRQEVNKVFDQINQQYGRVDYAFNNAGRGILSKPFGKVTDDEIDGLISLDVKAVMYCMINELKFMTKQHFGRIVNTTSGAGLVAGKGMALYSACKHAVVGLTKAAALDYAKEGITINAVAPGTIATELILPYKKIAPDQFKQWEDSNPIGRLGKPAEIGHAVKFLFEDKSEFINGVILPVDSGCVAGNF